jgi:hypothetical protein
MADQELNVRPITMSEREREFIATREADRQELNRSFFAPYTIWTPAMNGYVCRSCGIPRNWNGREWVNPAHKANCATNARAEE